MGTPQSFPAMFSKGDNFRDFPFAYLEGAVFPKWNLLSFLYEMTPIYMEGNNENDKIAFLESASIRLK